MTYEEFLALPKDEREREYARELKEAEARYEHLKHKPLGKDIIQVMAFKHVSKINLSRCLMWHNGRMEEWSAADWSNAMVGEAGEVANAVKKYRRLETGVQQKEGPQDFDEAKAAIKKEIGDTYLYLDLLAQFFGIDMWEAIRDTFNRVSEREGFPHRLDGGEQ